MSEIIELLDEKAWELRAKRIEIMAKKTGKNLRVFTLGERAGKLVQEKKATLKRKADLHYGWIMEEAHRKRENRGCQRAVVFRARRERIEALLPPQPVDAEEEKAKAEKQQSQPKSPEPGVRKSTAPTGPKKSVFQKQQDTNTLKSLQEQWGYTDGEEKRYKPAPLQWRWKDALNPEKRKTKGKHEAPRNIIAALPAGLPVEEALPPPENGTIDSTVDVKTLNMKNFFNIPIANLEILPDEVPQIMDVVDRVAKSKAVDWESLAPDVSKHARAEEAGTCRSAFMRLVLAPHTDKNAYHPEHFWTCSFGSRLRMKGLVQGGDDEPRAPKAGQKIKKKKDKKPEEA